jgi:nucleoid-associated protein YgaU
MAIKKTSKKKALKKSAAVAKKAAKKAARKSAAREISRVAPPETYREPEPYRIPGTAEGSFPESAEESKSIMPAAAVFVALVLIMGALYFFNSDGEEMDTQKVEETKPAEMGVPKAEKPVTEAPTMETKPVETAPVARTYKVGAKDSLYSIAKSQLGNGNRYKEILELNRGILPTEKSPLKPGMTIQLPAK